MFYSLRRKNLAIMCVLVFAVAQLLFVVNGSVSYAIPETNTSEQSDIEAIVEESNSERTVIKFNIKNFTTESVTIDDEIYNKIICEDTRLLQEKGHPELPRLNGSIIIPMDGDAELKIIDTEYEDFTLTPIAPSKGSITRDIDPSTVPYTFSDTYESSDWYPNGIASISKPFIMRDLRGANIIVNAFRYQGSTQTLRVYRSVTVEIVNSSSVSMATTQITPAFEGTYDFMFLNYNKVSSKSHRATSQKMLVITNDAYNNAMKPFVAWKNKKGISTEMVNISQVSSSNKASEIKTYIQNYYNKHKDLVYVLLVGDYAQVSSPTYHAPTYNKGVSDPEYTKVSGNDNYPDIFVGRFSAESIADVETQVKRTLDFEQNGYSNRPWYKKGTGIASNLGPGHNGEYDNQHMDIIRGKLLGVGYTHIDQIYDPGATAQQVTNSLNAGRGIVNYCGHGSSESFGTTGFSNADIKKLTNASKLPFIISVACVNGKFFDRTCFAEVWLRSKDVRGNPIGAIATYMSTVSQPWVPPMRGQDGINDIIVNKTAKTFGAICYTGATKMLQNGSADDIVTFNTWTVFGDPSIQLFD
ncbi:C25 family cysteine peptidase [Clostridiaceae bacterium M8S5]|nr:C25 family cysteine peptidase [Clostridiaceae bacterium M8S5]